LGWIIIGRVEKATIAELKALEPEEWGKAAQSHHKARPGMKSRCCHKRANAKSTHCCKRA